MINKNSIDAKLQTDLPVSTEMSNAISLWSELYSGHAPWLSHTVKSLNLPATIAAEVARMTTIELKSEVTGSKRADFLNEQYRQVLEKIRNLTEFACAKGGLVLKPYIDGKGISVDAIQADCFFPAKFDQFGNISGAVFLEQYQPDSKRIFTRLEYHELVKDGYVIKNRAYVSYSKNDIGKEVPLASVEQWARLEPEVLIRGVEKPLFSYFKMPQANNIDTHSPLGVSVYSRAVGLIREADRQYSRLLWEFESGERALYLSDTAFQRDEDGNPRLPDRRAYRVLAVDDPDFFHDWTPTLREQNILNGLNALLIKIEDVCGLARGTFSDPQNEAKTATELKILRQRSFATVADTQKALQNALSGLIYAMDVWTSIGKLAPEGNFEISFEFDDSIVSDRADEFAEKQLLVEKGIMQPWELRMWYFGESEKAAKDALADVIEPQAKEEPDENELRQAEFDEKQRLVESGIMQPWEFRMWYFKESEKDAKRAVKQIGLSPAEEADARAAELADKQKLVQAGIMQPWELRMWYFNETEEEARAAIEEIETANLIEQAMNQPVQNEQTSADKEPESGEEPQPEEDTGEPEKMADNAKAEVENLLHPKKEDGAQPDAESSEPSDAQAADQNAADGKRQDSQDSANGNQDNEAASQEGSPQAANATDAESRQKKKNQKFPFRK